MADLRIACEEWAGQQFGGCALGDPRRVSRLVTVAAQMAARPDGSTPTQTESWADCQGAYRLFNNPAVSFDAIIAPHCALTRACGRPGDVMLILNDTTEVNYGSRKVEGLGRVGRGSVNRGFYLHSGLMVNERTGQVLGLAGQTLFHREPQAEKKEHKNTIRRKDQRESVVWGQLFDKIGRPPPGVHWVHVCDRGADDYEVFCRGIAQGCDFVIRAARLNRWILDPAQDDKRLSLAGWLDGLTVQGTHETKVLAQNGKPGRVAQLELRHGKLTMPRPRVCSPWIREHAPLSLTLWVVELREVAPPAGVETPVHWVLYTTQPVQDLADAHKAIAQYEQRPTIEDFHKGQKTGCHMEERYYRTAARLERVTGLISVLAVRLLQIKTVARETPGRPARELVPLLWITILQGLRKKAIDPDMTIDKFVRALGGLGGHLGRKHDGYPGWITLWRGMKKLHDAVRGAELARQHGA